MRLIRQRWIKFQSLSLINEKKYSSKNAEYATWIFSVSFFLVLGTLGMALEYRYKVGMWWILLLSDFNLIKVLAELLSSEIKQITTDIKTQAEYMRF